MDSLNLLPLDLEGENYVENFRVLAGRRVSRQFEEFSPVLTLVSWHDLTRLLPFSYNADLSDVGLISFLLICDNQRWIQLSALSALSPRPTSESKFLQNISNFTFRFLMSDISEVVGWFVLKAPPCRSLTFHALSCPAVEVHQTESQVDQ